MVDQFEELFTVCDDADRRRGFIDALLARDSPVIIGVRADMYGRLASHPELARAVAASQSPPGGNERRGSRAGGGGAGAPGRATARAGLVEIAVRDVAGEPGALPLLSHALRATWDRRDGRTLTVNGYRESGGVGAAVARTADDLLMALPSERRQLMRNTFVRLTEFGDDRVATRRRVRTDELVPDGVSSEVVDTLLKRLADARLLTLGEGTAEVAHEVLIREWPTLRLWLDEDRDGIRLHRQLGDAARMWEAGGREPSDLYRGPRLVAATDWVRAHRPELNATERSFIDASVAEVDRERRSQLGANRRLRGLLAGAVALLLVAILAGGVALIQRHNAQAQALTSDAERIGAQALTEQVVDRSLLLSVAAVKLQNRPETRSDLFANLQQNAALIRLIRPSHVEVSALRVSPDGRLLAVADLAGTVRFIDLRTWQPNGPTVHLADPIAERALSFSPDGRTLMAVAIGAARAELYAIDVARRRARRLEVWTGPAPTPPIGFEAVAYSPDGRHVAVTHDIVGTDGSGLPDGRATGHARCGQRARRMATALPARPRTGQPPRGLHGRGTLLTSAQQGDTLLWNPETGRIIRRFGLGGLPALAPDGHTVALGQNSPSAGDQSSAITLLDLRTGRRHALLATLSRLLDP